MKCFTFVIDQSLTFRLQVVNSINFLFKYFTLWVHATYEYNVYLFSDSKHGVCNNQGRDRRETSLYETALTELMGYSCW